MTEQTSPKEPEKVKRFNITEIIRFEANESYIVHVQEKDRHFVVTTKRILEIKENAKAI